ncbi:Bug family tripartite tricarboxylate transporter substrate binding protein [Cupriavidus sp. NPDC089707]|uniref:Bug family tripartite tricarboxylate transporter substrate binding protein n=1 Tax=Cupriavidus sp. NPDC089707 TaxID=3363963 RepID=UPI0037F61CEF
MKRISMLCCMGWLLAGLLHHSAPRAAEPDWPAGRPIRMIIPSGAGSGTDIFARIIGARLSQALRQTIVFDNKPGANGIIGNDIAAKAAPDGYTILFSNASAIAVNPAVHRKLPYQVLNDLAPIAQVGSGGVLLVVTPDVPARDIGAFVKYVRAQPENAVYATWGIGSTGHLSMEALRARENLKLMHAPYKTSGQILTDLQGGTLKLAFVDAASSLPLIKAGKLVPLGVTGKHRVPALPDLPTMQEQGYGLAMDGWYGLFAPAGTPQAVVQRLNAEINRILAATDMRPAFESRNMSAPQRKTPAEFAQTVREDIDSWRDIAQAARITLD